MRRLRDPHERLAGVAVAVQGLRLVLGERSREPCVARDLETARVRGEVRRERDAARLAGETRQGLLDLGDVAVPGRAVRLDAAVHRREVGLLGGARPAPETPDLPSIAGGPSTSRPRPAARGRGSRGRVAAGVRDARRAGDRLARELGQAIHPVGAWRKSDPRSTTGVPTCASALPNVALSPCGRHRNTMSHARAPRSRARRSPRSEPGADRPRSPGDPRAAVRARVPRT